MRVMYQNVKIILTSFPSMLIAFFHSHIKYYTLFPFHSYINYTLFFSKLYTTTSIHSCNKYTLHVSLHFLVSYIFQNQF
jgi:hypothetical protein